MNLKAFHEKVVFITGASSGIGEALAREYARQGAHLALFARRRDRLEALAAELRSSSCQVLICEGDVTTDGSLERAISLVRTTWGRVDVVVANAGFGVTGAFRTLTLDDYRRQFETNVFGVLRTAQASRAALEESRGQLLVMGSVMGHVSLPGSSPYAMSKFAVRAFAESLRAEWHAAGIGVTYIAPGFVETEIRLTNNKGIVNLKDQDPVNARLRMPAALAARLIVNRSRCHSRREIVITKHGHLAVFLSRHCPGLVAWIGTKLRRSHRGASINP